MMTSQILKSVECTKTQKSRYFENETLFLLQIKKIINCASRATLWDTTTRGTLFCSGGNLEG